MPGTASVILSLLVAAAPKVDETKDLVRGKVGERVATFVRGAESVGFAGAVLAAVDGEVVLAIGVGSADLEGAVPNTPATLFEIASATKQFTGAAAAKLFQARKLDLDDSIAEHLPGVPDDCREITVRHLLRHTSGIPGTNSKGGGDDLAAVLPLFLAGGPVHPPGEHWEYWNQGYALASEIIARSSGKSYVEFCEKELFRPAGMKSTGFTGDAPPRGATVAIGRSARGAPRSAFEHPYGSYGFQYRGMGGAVTNVWDLWRWDRALDGKKILKGKAKEALFEPGPNDYALGWTVRRNDRGRTVHSHGGAVRGFVCDVRRFPERDGAVFVLSCRDDADVRRIADGVEEALFGDPPTIVPTPRPLDDALRGAVAGRYEDDRGAAIVVRVEGEVVRAEIHWSPGGSVSSGFLGLDEDGGVVFYHWTGAPAVRVERDGATVAALSVESRRFRRVP